MNLKKYQEKKYPKIGIVIFTFICVLLIAVSFFISSFASFTANETRAFINGDVEKPQDIYFTYYVDNKITNKIPSQNTGYILDEEKSSCTNNVEINWDYNTWKFKGNYQNYQKETMSSTKCTLYFKKTKTVNTILGNLEVYEYTPDFTKSACDDESCGSHEKGIYETTDADGPTYYYRGSVDNNYFYFANLWWRVVRINGDGTIRLIYDGTTAHENGEVSADRQYGTSEFNPENNDNMYGGYMYTSGEAHGLSTSSTIKQANDAFYDAKLSSFTNYIDSNAGFCGDRSTLNLENGVGTGTVTTYNKGYLRVVESAPSLACENTSDLYTMTNASKGNKSLIKPIGLLTADEALLAGLGGGMFDGVSNYQPENPNGYLTTGNRLTYGQF